MQSAIADESPSWEVSPVEESKTVGAILAHEARQRIYVGDKRKPGPPTPIACPIECAFCGIGARYYFDSSRNAAG